MPNKMGYSDCFSLILKTFYNNEGVEEISACTQMQQLTQKYTLLSTVPPF